MGATPPMNSIRLAAVFAASLRPRQVQLNPRIFHILSRPQPKVHVVQQRVFSVAARRHNAAQELPAEEETRSLRADLQEPSVEDGAGDGAVNVAEEALPAGEKSREGFNVEEQQLEFKNHMRTVPHPVAIITTQPSTAENDGTAVVGATVSSFNTVSFDPDLIVSFNLTQDSATYRTILESKHFCVNFPTSNKAGMDLASSFTKGNEIPPLSPEIQPVVGPVNFHELQGQSPPSMKQYPPGVKLKNKRERTEEAGFAFAFICEYQSSLPVGDHVIVTGRLIPHKIRSSKKFGWGLNPVYGNSYAASHTTLAYVHGRYGVDDNTGTAGIDDIWKIDDRLRQFDPEKMADYQVENAIRRYENRIKTIQTGRILQQGINVRGPLYIPSHIEQRAAELPLSRLDDLERYYKERLTIFEARLARGSLTAKPEDETNAESGGTPAWQNLSIRKKMLLSEVELQKEGDLYSARLEKLHIQKAQHSGDTQAAPSAELERINELIAHVQERLDIIQEAKRRKLGVQSSIPIKQLRTQQVARLLESKRALAYDALKRGYRRDRFQIQEAQLSLIEQENSPGPKSQEAIQQLKDRIAYYTETAELIEGLMAERVKKADPSELNAMIKVLPHGMSAPPPAPEKGRKKQKKNHGKEAMGNFTSVEGARDDEGNWVFPRKKLIGTAYKKAARKAGYVSTPDAGQTDIMTARDLEKMHASQVDARHESAEGDHLRNVKEGQDPLVMKHFEGEEIPSWPNAEEVSEKRKG